MYFLRKSSKGVVPFSNCLLLPLHTVDRKNPAPVEVGSLFHYLQGFGNTPGGDRRMNHQPYVCFIWTVTVSGGFTGCSSCSFLRQLICCDCGR